MNDTETSKSFTFVPSQAGGYVFRATLVDLKECANSDPNDNKATSSVTVGAPDRSCDMVSALQITPIADGVESGKKRNVTVNVTRTSLDVDGAELVIYVDGQEQ